MAIKCIFVGDEPNAQARTRTPFRHAKCAERLQSWVDYLIGDEDYVVVNQCDYTPETFEAMLYFVPCNKIVALGNKAAKLCENTVTDVFTSDHSSFFKLPHPSGRNRQLNDKAKLFLKLKACKAYLG